MNIIYDILIEKLFNLSLFQCIAYKIHETDLNIAHYDAFVSIIANFIHTIAVFVGNCSPCGMRDGIGLSFDEFDVKSPVFGAFGTVFVISSIITVMQRMESKQKTFLLICLITRNIRLVCPSNTSV